MQCRSHLVAAFHKHFFRAWLCEPQWVASKKAWFILIPASCSSWIIMGHHTASLVPTPELCPHHGNDRHFPGPSVGTPKLLCAFKCERSEHPPPCAEFTCKMVSPGHSSLEPPAELKQKNHCFWRDFPILLREKRVQLEDTYNNQLVAIMTLLSKFLAAKIDLQLTWSLRQWLTTDEIWLCRHF